jgi:hypothetical protein
MNNKFKIIETPNYILAVSDEEIKQGTYHVASDGWYIEKTSKEDLKVVNDKNNGYLKAIAYKPKNNAPELDLPLLPEIVIEDDVEKFACNIYNLSYEEYLHIREHVSQTRESVEAEYEHLGLEIPNKYFDVLSFIVGYNYKSATKVYSEDDLLNLAKFITSKYRINPWINNPIGESEFKNHDSKTITNLFIQSLKQHKTLKWFVAEMEGCDNCINHQGQHLSPDCCHNYKLKTTTINGKKYLVGTYLYE